MLPQIQPWIDDEELKEITDVIKSTWITEHKKTEAFEQGIRELTQAPYALSVSNGTIGLYTCLKILGIGRGDEVIVPDLTFIATSNAVIMADATPVFVDIDKESFTISPHAIEAAISPKTRAIMPVHLYGHAADMDAIMKIAAKHNLAVIEDAAQGVGVRFNGKHTGTFGKLGVLSFYGNKTITTGEGGTILTSDEALYKKCWQLKNHGREVKGTFIHPHIGFNFSFTDLQAAIGVAQLRKLPRIIAMKQHVRETYQQLLSDVKEVRFPRIDPRCSPVFWFTNILIDDAEGLAAHLEKRDIQTRRFFYPLHKQPAYKGMVSGEFPNAEWAYEHGLSLPSTATLSDEQIRTVCNAIKEFYR